MAQFEETQEDAEGGQSSRRPWWHRLGRLFHGGRPRGARPGRIRDQKEFRAALRNLRGEKTFNAVARDGDLSVSTISQTLDKDKLPSQDFTVKYLRGCEVGEEDQREWLSCWARLNNQPVQGVRQGSHWAFPRGGGDRRPRVALAAGTALALAAGLAAWQLRQGGDKEHCGTSNPSLVTQADGECTGVTDGSDGAAVFGSDLKPVLTAIGAENKNVVEGGDYVTFAFLTPLTSTDANSLTVGQYVAELEGAYTAVAEENRKNSRPKIRLLVASMGSAQRHWEHAVDELVKRKDSDRLVAVVGMGLSQQETVDAARKLSKADLPMVGDLITADGFNATGAVDGKGPINGLARVALSNSDQLTAISDKLPSGRRTAALVSTSVTPNGTRDLYTESLNRGFRTIDGLKKHLDDHSDFAFDPRGGPDAILPTISQNFCNTGKTIDTVYYAARVKYLPDFLDALTRRSCHAQPITVITGSDAAALDPKTEALHDPASPITVLYASFPKAEQFRAPGNPGRGLYQAFVKAFTAPHHGQQFPAEHLTESYWGIVAYDAVTTAATALHNAAAHNPSTSNIPNNYAVRNELYALRNNAVAGASGHFGIDKNGDRTNTDTVTTVHRLGKPLPKTPQSTN
jgi:hypothetical protein